MGGYSFIVLKFALSKSTFDGFRTNILRILFVDRDAWHAQAPWVFWVSC